MNKIQKQRTKMEYEALGKMLEDLYLQQTISKRKLLWNNFLRGLANGFGIFLAGTVLIAFLLWFLGLFDDVPLISGFVQSIIDSLQ